MENCNWIVDGSVCDTIFSRVRGALPEGAVEVAPGADALGINARFRCYKYQGGDYFKFHTDGSWPGAIVAIRHECAPRTPPPPCSWCPRRRLPTEPSNVLLLSLFLPRTTVPPAPAVAPAAAPAAAPAVAPAAAPAQARWRWQTSTATSSASCGMPLATGGAS